jgi:cytochrome c oxidase cbb3-type subunit 3
MKKIFLLIGLTGVCLAGVPLGAQAPQGRGNADSGVARLRAFDPAAVERGKTAFGEKCASCHRANARGGQGFAGPDLLRSVLVLQDVNGQQIGAHLQSAHKPPIALTPPQIADIGTFLHREITYAAERTNYQLQYVMTGNAAAGEAYFNGAGGCAKCHSPTGDLAGLATRLQGLQLFQRMLYPGGRGRGGESRATPVATVQLASGETITGKVAYKDEFNIAITDASGYYRSWPTGKVKVTINNPLDAHIAQLGKYTNDDLHNVLAYLQTLK